MIIGFNGSVRALKALVLFLILGLTPVLFAVEDDPEIILNEVIQELSRRNFSAALALFDRLKPEDAEKKEFLIMRASVLNSSGKPAEAKKIANGIIAGNPNDTDALMILADAAAVEGKDRERRTALEKVINADPKHVRALTDLGNINLGTRSLKVAAGYFDRALAAEPANGEAMVGRAIVYRYTQEPKKAEQLLNRAIARYPQWAEPLHERARLYKGAGYINDALRDLNAAKELEPGNYWISTDRGLLLIDMDRKPEALEELSSAIKLDPQNFLAYVYSAGLKYESGDYTGAEQDFARLARLRPDYYYASESLGMIKMKNKKWAEARDAFLDAYKQAPREYNYALLAAVNWMRAGRQTDPKQFLAQVLKTLPRDSVEYSVIRLFHDLSGDSDAAVKVEQEKNLNTKAQMLFYLACYYDIRGNRTLADRYYTMVQEIGNGATIEWQLNEWILQERGIGLRN